jgi:hypothetical protein
MTRPQPRNIPPVPIRLALGLSLALAALGGCARSSEDQVDLGTEENAQRPVCRDPLLDPEVLARQREADRALRSAARKGGADPVAAANEALAIRDFRLAARTVPAPGTAEPYGASCRVPGGLDSRSARLLAYEGGRDDGGAILDFGRRYNEVVLASPEYPYRDICRAGDEAPDPAELEAQPYGFPVVRREGEQVTFEEAARRGSEWTLLRFLRKEPEIANRPDMFGMTPLGWAVAYRKPGAVQMLLGADASPAGPQCQSVLDVRAPVQVARQMQWISMVERMLPRISPADRENLVQKTAAIPATLIAFNAVLRDLNDRYIDDLAGGKTDQHQLMLEIDEKGKTVACRLEPATQSPRFDAELCANATLMLRWSPARNIYGQPVKGETSINLVGVGR